MYQEILNKRAAYESKILHSRIELDRKKTSNEKINQYRAALQECNDMYDKANEYLNALKVVETAVTKEAREYQNRRIKFIDEVITKAVAKIFPDRNIKAELNCDFSRTDRVSLTLTDDSGYSFIPFVGEGKLLQYLVSVSAVASITKSLGCDNLYIDEAFGVARVDHLEDLGDLLQTFINSKLQIILVSQNPVLYQNLDRHVISLETIYDPCERYAVVKDIQDVQGVSVTEDSVAEDTVDASTTSDLTDI